MKRCYCQNYDGPERVVVVVMNRSFQHEEDQENGRGETGDGNTATSPNGGHKSNPPMVAGEGKGAAEDTKSLDADAAREKASNPETDGSSNSRSEISRDRNSILSGS